MMTGIGTPSNHNKTARPMAQLPDQNVLIPTIGSVCFGSINEVYRVRVDAP
jgi:hypothetical protein